MIHDLLGAVDDFADDYVVLATDPWPLGADGFQRTGVVTERTVRLMWWPATGREIAQLPEGERGNETIGWACTTELFTSKVEGAPAERIVINGAEWKINKTFPWGHLGNFYAGFAQKVCQ